MARSRQEQEAPLRVPPTPVVGPEPNPGTVYRVNGEAMLYVRTEQRPGVDHAQHLFVKSDRRMTFQVWVDKMPPEAELTRRIRLVKLLMDQRSILSYREAG